MRFEVGEMWEYKVLESSSTPGSEENKRPRSWLGQRLSRTDGHEEPRIWIRNQYEEERKVQPQPADA